MIALDLGSASSYDRLQVGGMASAGYDSSWQGFGKLSLHLASGYAPALNEALPVMTYSTRPVGRGIQSRRRQLRARLRRAFRSDLAAGVSCAAADDRQSEPGRRLERAGADGLQPAPVATLDAADHRRGAGPRWHRGLRRVAVGDWLFADEDVLHVRARRGAEDAHPSDQRRHRGRSRRVVHRRDSAQQSCQRSNRQRHCRRSVRCGHDPHRRTAAGHALSAGRQGQRYDGPQDPPLHDDRHVHRYLGRPHAQRVRQHRHRHVLLADRRSAGDAVRLAHADPVQPQRRDAE